jgi:hypothetical protein
VKNIPASLIAVSFLICQAIGSQAASTTLLIYDTLSKPYSLVNEVAPIKLILTAFDTRVESRVDSSVTPADLQKADFIVLAGISGFPKMPPEVLKSLEISRKPIMAVGAASCFAFDKPGSVAKSSTAVEKGKVSYRGRGWTLRLDPFYSAPLQGLETLAEATTPSGVRPLAWNLGKRFGFATLPGEPPLSMIFSDVLLDFYGVNQSAKPSMVFVVEDFNPSCNLTSQRRLSDYFSHKKTPFVVTTQMKEVPPGVEIAPRDEFLDALRYAQAHGARIFLRGGNGDDRSEIFRKEGIRIDGSENTPSGPSGLEIGSSFLQRIPSETPVAFSSAVPLRLDAGGWLLPPNARGGMDGPANTDLLKTIRDISAFRGGLAVVVIPAWMRFQDMLSAVEVARSANLDVIDPVTQFPIPSI